VLEDTGARGDGCCLAWRPVQHVQDGNVYSTFATCALPSWPDAEISKGLVCA
jgi:hypothetical protein